VVLLELPGHGRSPPPPNGPLSAREYGAIVIACAEEMFREHGGKVLLIGNSLGGALGLYAAHERPDLCAAVVGINPAGAELSDEAMTALPRAFDDANAGAARMARLLFHRTPWPFWLVARDFARHWGTATVQRILDDARAGNDRSLGLHVLTDIHVPVLILWGAQDRLLPLRSIEDFARIHGARVEMLHGCGHVPQLEKPAVTRRAVAEFIDSLK
jgi:2-hydroxymuconate-semialdehyde hydrolase